MRIKKINPETKYLYHFTLKSNIGSILKDKSIRSGDDYVFFTESLTDAVTAFNNEIMSVGKPYIDADCNLRYREKCSREDYCILKIPYINDGQFCRFEFDDLPDDSIYKISVAHKGQYGFKRAEVLEIPDKKRRNKLPRLAAAGLALGLMLAPYKVFADSWLDDGNYDVSWYNAYETVYSFDHSSELEKKLAGASCLSSQGKFEGTINVNCSDYRCGGNIDLSAHSWTPLRGVDVCFDGIHTFDGIHRIILKYGDSKFTQEDSQGNSFVSHYTNIKAGDGEWTIALFDKTTAADVSSDINTTYSPENWAGILDKAGATAADQLLLTHNSIEVFDDEVVSDLLTSETDHVEYLNRDNLPYSVKVEDPSRPSPDNIRRIFSDPSADIRTIREKISTIAGVPAGDLVLTTDNAAPLVDGKTLADYDIADGTRILYRQSHNWRFSIPEVSWTPDSSKKPGDPDYYTKEKVIGTWNCLAKDATIQKPASKIDFYKKADAKCTEDGKCTYRAWFDPPDSGSGNPIAQNKDVTIPATGHKWNSGRITTAAACETYGVKTYTCTACSATKTSSIAPHGHSFGEWHQIKAPDCIDHGGEERSCSICGPIDTRVIDPDPDAHDWDEGKVTKKPTTKKEGVRTYTCRACEVTRTESIARITGKTNTLKVKGRTAEVSYSRLMKKDQILAAGRMITFRNKGQGRKTYRLVSAKKGKKSFIKKFRINDRTGKVTVKKGLKRGTYKVRVKVRAAGNDRYKASGWKTVIVRVKVK